MDCPWHTEANIWTGRSFSNRKAVERQGRTTSLYSVETAVAPLQAGWWPKGGIPEAFVCVLLPQLVWPESLRSKSQQLSQCCLPFCHAQGCTGGFWGQISWDKSFELLRFGSKEALMCVLAQTCKGVNPCLPAKGGSNSYVRHKSYSWRYFERFSSILLFSGGVIFSRSQPRPAVCCTHLPKIVSLVRIFLFFPFNSKISERYCPNIPPVVIIFNDTSSDRKEYGSH